MHIPTCQTQDLEILTFQQALVPTNGDYDRTKWLYVPDYYADYRYLLGTRGENPLICIGINPSTAAPDDLSYAGDEDRDIARLLERAEEDGDI